MKTEKASPQCDKCNDKKWISNNPPWPLLGPMSVECPKCFGGRKKITSYLKGQEMCDEEKRITR